MVKKKRKILIAIHHVKRELLDGIYVSKPTELDITRQNTRKDLLDVCNNLYLALSHESS